MKCLNRFNMILDSNTLTELIHLQTLNANMVKTPSKINLATANEIDDNVIIDVEQFFKDIVDLFNNQNRGIENSAQIIHNLIIDHSF